MAPYLLGIDIGGTAIKAALYTLGGREIKTASAAVRISTPRPGWSERDAQQTWEETASVILKVIQLAAIDPNEIAAVGCTGHGNGLYAIDNKGLPVRPAINSSDIRAQDIVDRWRFTGVESRLRSKTAQRIWAAQPPALLAWLRSEEPSTFERIRWILLCKDFIRYRLTGEIWAEKTDYSGASLLNVPESRYDAEVLREFDLLEIASRLPPLVDSASVCGKIVPAASAVTGLAIGTPVAAGMFDIDACCLASGLVDDSKVALIAGTWGNCLSVQPHAVIDGDVFMTSCFAIPQKFLILEGSPSSVVNLEWAIQRFGIASYEAAEREAGSVTPNDGPFFFPFINGSNDSPNASGCFLGLRESHSLANFMFAVYEGIAFAYRQHLERLLRLCPKPESIRLSGGSARSAFWRQLIADVLGLTIEISEGEELGAKGAAIAAGVAVGLFRSYDEAVLSMTRVIAQNIAQPERHRAFNERFQRFQALTAQFNSIWPILSNNPQISRKEFKDN